ncbi:MAG: flagellar hook-length control protein FliK [Selenomonas sp.]|uniref:flagellar hook-length control protein FliK n=1 Tax=Selenomonas sp. TaxID=2053611 RepID=UPI0025FCA5BD|nr:flagellar hook-length control protein FliK [Selenomonas sp.]MCI6231746.1 flagellar hook-length control protein FliK [Selenomonas sp.]
MNNVQIMSTSPQAGTAKAGVKSSSVSKTAKSSGFDDVLQKSQAQAQNPKAAAQDAKNAVQDAKDAAGSAADETEASAAAAAAEKNPAAKTKAKGKDAKQGTKNDADAKEAVSDDGNDILAEAAQAAVDAKLVLAQAVAENDNGVQAQELTATDVAAEAAGTVEDLAQALLDASSSRQQNAQAALQSILPQDASKGQAQKTMLAMLSGQNLSQEAASSAAEQGGQVLQASAQPQAVQSQNNSAIQQLLAQMTPSTQADTQTVQQPFADLQNISTLNANVQQMPQVQAQAAASLPFQSAAETSQTEAPTVKASDFANLLGTNVTSTSADDLALTQQVVAAPQNSGSSLGDFLKGSSQQSGQAMAEMVQTADGTETVTQLPEEAAFDKVPTTQEAVPTQTGITSFAQTLQNIDGTQASQTAQAAQQPQTDYDVPQQIVDQARLIQRGQDTEMVIHLKPEHLGDLTLRVSVGVDGAVNASFHSNNAEVRTIIENTLVQLKQDLNDQGIKVDNVGVYAGLADGGLPQDSGQQSWQQGSSQGQHHSTQESAEAFEDGQELAAALAAQKEGNAATDGVDYRV